jgi:nitrite reductase/ring-hydroxylating ferredoxin subunit/uncharacterized membrane protein
MLVALPIAAIVGGFGFDLAGKLGEWPGLWSVGGWLSLAAIASGLLAAVPGVIDYLYAVPPNSSGKRRATEHAIVNSSALLAFALGWLFRDGTTWEPGVGTLILEGLAVGLVARGGWLGGVLVFRNQIGVDHRYAQAGKWQEQTVEGQPGQWAVVARDDELKAGQMKLLRLGERRIVLARTEEGYVAFDDRCTHRGGSLAGGVLAGCLVTCPWHGSQYDVRSGAVKSGPAEHLISTYLVEEAGRDVRLRLPAGT